MEERCFALPSSTHFVETGVKEACNACQNEELRSAFAIARSTDVFDKGETITNLPNKAKLGLYFNPFGKIADLIDDCIASGVDNLLVKYGDIRTSDAFENVKEHIRGELGEAMC